MMTKGKHTNGDHGNGNRGTRIVDQKEEIDCRYPAEAVRMRWNEGYRVSHVAANSEECVVCMTRPVGGYGGGSGELFPQECVRSNQCGVDDVEKKWDEMEVVALAYGRTMWRWGTLEEERGKWRRLESIEKNE